MSTVATAVPFLMATRNLEKSYYVAIHTNLSSLHYQEKNLSEDAIAKKEGRFVEVLTSRLLAFFADDKNQRVPRLDLIADFLKSQQRAQASKNRKSVRLSMRKMRVHDESQILFYELNNHQGESGNKIFMGEFPIPNASRRQVLNRTWYRNDGDFKTEILEHVSDNHKILYIPPVPVVSALGKFAPKGAAAPRDNLGDEIWSEIGDEAYLVCSRR